MERIKREIGSHIGCEQHGEWFVSVGISVSEREWKLADAYHRMSPDEARALADQLRQHAADAERYARENRGTVRASP